MGCPNRREGCGGVGRLAGVGGQLAALPTLGKPSSGPGPGLEGSEETAECVDILDVWARKSSRMATTGSQTMLRGYRPESVSEMRA